MVRLVSVVVVALYFLMPTTLWSAPYQITLLEGVDRVADLNNAGQVVGTAGYPSAEQHAVLWHNGVVQNLTPDHAYGQATAISDTGFVTGFVEEFWNRGFVWNASSGLRVLPALGDNHCNARHINNAGRVVGECVLGLDTYALIWTAAGGVEFVPHPPSYYSHATAINNRGQVVGYHDVGGAPSHIFLTDLVSAVTTDLGGFGTSQPGPGFGRPFPADINDQGDIVVAATVTVDRAVSYLWHNGTSSDLGSLGGTRVAVEALNNLGQAVGFSTLLPEQSGMYHAFIYEDGQMHDLNDRIPPDSGWVLEVAAGINDRGFIVGEGKYLGQSRSYLLTPVPEPATWVLSVVALLSLLSKRLR